MSKPIEDGIPDLGEKTVLKLTEQEGNYTLTSKDIGDKIANPFGVVENGLSLILRGGKADFKEIRDGLVVIKTNIAELVGNFVETGRLERPEFAAALEDMSKKAEEMLSVFSEGKVTLSDDDLDQAAVALDEFKTCLKKVTSTDVKSISGVTAIFERRSKSTLDGGPEDRFVPQGNYPFPKDLDHKYVSHTLTSPLTQIKVHLNDLIDTVERGSIETSIQQVLLIDALRILRDIIKHYTVCYIKPDAFSENEPNLKGQIEKLVAITSDMGISVETSDKDINRLSFTSIIELRKLKELYKKLELLLVEIRGWESRGV